MRDTQWRDWIRGVTHRRYEEHNGGVSAVAGMARHEQEEGGTGARKLDSSNEWCQSKEEGKATLMAKVIGTRS